MISRQVAAIHGVSNYIIKGVPVDRIAEGVKKIRVHIMEIKAEVVLTRINKSNRIQVCPIVIQGMPQRINNRRVMAKLTGNSANTLNQFQFGISLAWPIMDYSYFHKYVFDYHHSSATRDNIATAIISNRV